MLNPLNCRLLPSKWWSSAHPVCMLLPLLLCWIQQYTYLWARSPCWSTKEINWFSVSFTMSQLHYSKIQDKEHGRKKHSEYEWVEASYKTSTVNPIASQPYKAWRKKKKTEQRGGTNTVKKFHTGLVQTWCYFGLVAHYPNSSSIHPGKSNNNVSGIGRHDLEEFPFISNLQGWELGRALMRTDIYMCIYIHRQTQNQLC